MLDQRLFTVEIKWKKTNWEWFFYIEFAALLDWIDINIINVSDILLFTLLMKDKAAV